MNTTPVPVVYIMGAGRSGSTALGIALGNVPGLYYGGELFSWNKFGGVPYTDDEKSLAHWADFATRFPPAARHFDRELHEIEHPSVLTRPTRLRPSTLRAHAEHNEALFHTLRDATGATAIVDSSHYPIRAALLRRVPSIDLYVIHLVRHPTDVVNALQNPAQRHRPMHPLAANLYCWSVAALSALTLRLLPARKRLLLRYEEFVLDPKAAIDRVCEMLQLPRADLDFSNLAVGEVFQGNRLRLRPTLAIAPQPGVDQLSRGWRRVTDILQRPVAWAGGYRNPRD